MENGPNSTELPLGAPEGRLWPVDLRGVTVHPGYLTPAEQADLVMTLRGLAEAAPFFSPVTRSGKAMSVRMTSAGTVGWFSDRAGYRYIDRHPQGGEWPAIPRKVLEIWRDVTGAAPDPDSCLINFYGEGARMGMHQDQDEADLSWPVVSISLGDDALFRVGNVEPGGKTESRWLKSGDVAVIAGAARLVHHGIDRIAFGTSPLLPKGGRINLTLRVAR